MWLFYEVDIFENQKKPITLYNETETINNLKLCTTRSKDQRTNLLEIRDLILEA